MRVGGVGRYVSVVRGAMRASCYAAIADHADRSTNERRAGFSRDHLEGRLTEQRDIAATKPCHRLARVTEGFDSLGRNPHQPHRAIAFRNVERLVAIFFSPNRLRAVPKDGRDLIARESYLLQSPPRARG